MLRVLLADAALELVPEEITNHPAVRRHAQALGRRPGGLLLDQNHHQAAMKDLPDAARRGRPDIVQITLLTLLESPLAKAGGLEAAVHTRDGVLLRIRPDTRLPRGESRFQGVFSRVLREGASQDRDPLIRVETTCDAAAALNRFAKGPVVRLDASGAAMDPAALARRAVDGDLTVVLGAFPSGAFPEAWHKAAPDAVSVWPEALNAWAVAAECAAGFRAVHGPGPWA